MIHHVSVLALEEQLDDCVEFYRVLGFEPIGQPHEVIGRGVWLERDDHHVHVLTASSLPEPSDAHAAYVVDDFDEVWQQFEKRGFAPVDRRRYWGAMRAFVRDPAGNLVEFMAYPPPPAAT